MRNMWMLACGLVLGCGSVKDSPDASVGSDGSIDATASFTVGGTVTGFAGQGLVLRINGGNDLTIAADGAFSFPTPLADGATYAVTIAAEPTCPQRRCTLTGDTGTIAGANATGVTVACAAPRYRLASHNWGGQSIRITDDVLALANNATAAPRLVTGSNTGLNDSELDSVAFDPVKDLIYAPATTVGATPTVGILVFANASTTTGNVAPARRIVVAGESGYNGVEIDEGANRLYVTGASGRLYVFDNANTANGTVTPTASIVVPTPGAIALDRTNDRLYVAGTNAAVHEFNNARLLTSASTATYTTTWTVPADSARAIAIDECRNRLYLGFRNATAAGVNVFAFDFASSLTGAIDLQAASEAQLVVPDTQVMSLALDSAGHLYFWKDSATSVRIVDAPHALAGMVTVVPDKTILGVADRGYGLAVMAY